MTTRNDSGRAAALQTLRGPGAHRCLGLHVGALLDEHLHRVELGSAVTGGEVERRVPILSKRQCGGAGGRGGGQGGELTAAWAA
jgi:hypothetical protein